MSESLFYVQCHELPIPHAFFGRKGGVSHGPFASLNGSFKTDDPAHVQENRERARSFLEVAQVFFLNQRHTNRVLILPQDRDLLEEPADALVTNDPQKALGLQTADCAPIFFYDSQGIIGAAHAGWRGAISGILENTTEAMKYLGATPETLIAVIGPTIRQHSYEVDSQLLMMVAQSSPFSVDEFFIPHEENRLFFDLPGYIKKRLEHQVAHIYDTGHDTFGEVFFSRRYALSQGENTFGDSISLISLL